MTNANVFNASRKTKVIIHGWRSSSGAEWVSDMKEAMLDIGDYNVILVDWMAGAGERKTCLASANTKIVGIYTAQLLNILHSEHGLQYKDVHIIGHSMGAQCAHSIATFLNGTVAQITGLDPYGGSCFGANSKYDRVALSKHDATFVDVIHSNTGFGPGWIIEKSIAESVTGGSTKIGVIDAIGHVDFYLNGATSTNTALCKRYHVFQKAGIETCEHQLAHQVYIQALKGEATEGKDACYFVGRQCASVKSAIQQSGECIRGGCSSERYGCAPIAMDSLIKWYQNVRSFKTDEESNSMILYTNIRSPLPHCDKEESSLYTRYLSMTDQSSGGLTTGL